MTDITIVDTARTAIALTDAELEIVAGAGVGEKIFGITLTTGGVLVTTAGVLTRQWGLAARGCTMAADGIGHIEAS